MKPGIYYDMPREQYDAIDAINYSRLKDGLQSMLHLKATLEGNRTDSAAMAFGRMVHCRLLEPDAFAQGYAIGPEGSNKNGLADKTSKAGKEAWAKWSEDHTDAVEAVSPSDWTASEQMVNSVKNHKVARQLLAAGHPEVSVVWVDDLTGLLCKCRIDWLIEDGQKVVDYKTTENASKSAIQRHILDYSYHVQAAFYCDGLHSVSGNVYPTAAYIWQEKKTPFAVATSRLRDIDLDIGRTEYQSVLQDLADCRRTGIWPGFPEIMQEIGLPSWKVNEYTREQESSSEHF